MIFHVIVIYLFYLINARRLDSSFESVHTSTHKHTYNQNIKISSLSLIESESPETSEYHYKRRHLQAYLTRSSRKFK